MNPSLHSFALAVTMPLVSCAGAPPGPAPDPRPALDAVFSNYEILDLDAARIARDARSGRLTLRLRGETYRLRLTPVELRARDASGALADLAGSAHVGHYAGDVEGVGGSHVRLTARDDLLRGFVRTPAGYLFIDPVSEFAGAAARSPGKALVYAPADVIQTQPATCGTGPQHRRYDRSAGAFMPARAVGATPRAVTVATDADYEYFQKYGSVDAVKANILSVLNQVNGIYALPDYTVTFNVVSQNVWTSSAPPNPYTATNGSQLLDQFAAYWNLNKPGVQRNVAHLFTGKNIDGGVVRVAYLGVVRTLPSLSYGFSQNYVPMSFVVAHELGHNFDAEHVCSACSCPSCDKSAATIMCPCIVAAGAARFAPESSCAIDNWIRHFGPAP